MKTSDFPIIRNNESVSLDTVPQVPCTEFSEAVLRTVNGKKRLCSLFAHAFSENDTRIFAVIGDDTQGRLYFLSCNAGKSFPSMTPHLPEAHLFEREIFEQFGIVPEGHPWCKPVRFEEPLSGGRQTKNDKRPPIGIADFFSMHGEEIHEVAVGPVHAGVIEPGHFRFQCHGEVVFHLEISLGYQHRGIEKAFVGATPGKRLRLMEAVAGDTTCGHTAAYCNAMESLSGMPVSTRSRILRAVAAELERCANHIGDLGALAGDVGYLPGLSYCGRIRGDFLNMSALLSGSRFSRGFIVPGGIGFEIGEETLIELQRRLAVALTDCTGAAELIVHRPSVQTRFENTGILSQSDCERLGIVGLASRASGCIRDVRQDYPYGAYRFSHIPVMSGRKGDVYDRATVRWHEMQQSIKFMREQINNIQDDEKLHHSLKLQENKVVTCLVEGWRGEICHTAITDGSGNIVRYKIVDPSFHNWFGLVLALRGMPVSDFPLCNKSFNLSYCGFDL